jgi:hypothetical protein
VQEFQRLYFLLGVASEAGTEEIAKNIEFLILKNSDLYWFQSSTNQNSNFY